MTHLSKLFVLSSGAFAISFAVSLVGAFAFAAQDASTPLKWPKTAVVHLRERLKNAKCALESDSKTVKDVCALYDGTSAAGGKSAKTGKTGAGHIGFRVSQPNDSLLIFESASQVIKISRGARANVVMINSANLNLQQSADRAAVKASLEKAMAIRSAKFSLWLPEAQAADIDADAVGAVHALIVEASSGEICHTLLEFGDHCIKGLKMTLDQMDRAAAVPAVKTDDGLGKLMGRNKRIMDKFALTSELGELRGRLDDQIFPSLKGYDSVRMCAFQKDPANADALEENATKKLLACNDLVKRMEQSVGSPNAPNTADIAQIRRMLNDLSGGAMAANVSASPNAAAGDESAARQ